MKPLIQGPGTDCCQALRYRQLSQYYYQYQYQQMKFLTLTEKELNIEIFKEDLSMEMFNFT